VSSFLKNVLSSLKADYNSMNTMYEDILLMTNKKDAVIQESYGKLPKLPDLNGMRYCRMCFKSLPLSYFPSGQRRFLCKSHLWKRIGQKSRKVRHANVLKKTLDLLWTQCWKDARFFDVVLSLNLKDLEQILHKVRERGDISIDQVAVVPKKTSMAFSNDNVAVISKTDRQMLIDELRRTQKLSKTDEFPEQRDELWRKEVETKSLLKTDN
jgi:hypothetical protein